MNFFRSYGNYHGKEKQRPLPWPSGLDPAIKRMIIMRINFVAFLLAVTIMNVCAKAHAQTVTLSLTNASLEKALQEISKQTGYAPIYNDRHLVKSHPVSIHVKATNFKEVLDKCFEGQPLSYDIIDKTIVVKLKPESFKDKIMGFLKKLIVTGKVLDEKGLPLQDVTVRVKGTNKVTVTDKEGKFSIEVLEDKAVLQFSFTGYQTQEFATKGNAIPVIILKEATNQLEELNVVNTGYQSLPKERATGSFVQIDNKLISRAISTDIISRLKGVASGLNFDYSSGNNVGITIRGRSTLISNTQPLIVLDNFPYEGDLNNINPNDVESITILKDAAASSIWGALAGNGVIVITTKRGKYNQPLGIDFNSNLTLQTKPNLNYQGNQFLNSSDYINVERTLFDSGFYDGQLNDIVNYPAVTPAVEILNNLRNGAVSSNQAKEQLSILGEHDVRKDLAKYYYREATQQQYSLNVKGGNSNINYFFSAGEDYNLKNEVGNKYNRFTLNSNVTLRPFENLELYTNVNYTNSNTASNSNVATLLSPGFLYPYATLADETGTPLSINKYYRSFFINDALKKGLLNWSYSPLEEMRNSDNTLNLSDIRINTGINYKIINGFSAEVRYQYDKVIATGRNFENENSYTVRNLVNSFSVINNGLSVTRSIPIGGLLDLSNNVTISNYLRGQLNYHNNWKTSELNIIVGSEARQIKGDGNSSRLYGYDSGTGTSQPVNYVDYLPTYPGNGSSIIPNNSGITQTTDRYRSFFGNASYSYNERYIVSASARFDQSNLFGVNTNQKGVPLWSTGIKWNINNETFYNFGWVPKISFRASYGYSGNVNKSISAYTIAKYQSSASVPAYNHAYIAYPGNPDLRWERIGMLNFGLDFELKKIFSGSFEYYRKYGSDLIGNSPIAASTGFTAATGNFANLKGSGFDFSLTSKNIDNNIFTWNTILLSSYAIDRVTKYLGGNTLSGFYGNIEVGKPFNSIFLNKFEGLDNKGNPQGILNGQLSKDYIALNNLPKAEKSAYRTQPAYFGSFRNDFSYKHFSLSVNLIYKAGYYFLRNGLNYNSLFTLGIGNADFEKRWQKAGDEVITSVPSIQYPNDSNRDIFYTNSTALVSNASNIRLQDINFSYLVTKQQWLSMPFKSVQATMYLNNVGLIWTKDKQGIDPDFQSGLVNPLSISFGLKFGLN